MATQLTTAACLGAFARELEDEGFDRDTIAALVLTAAQQTIHPDTWVVSHKKLREQDAS